MPTDDDTIKALFVTDDDYWNLLRGSKDIGTEYELELARSDDEALSKMRAGT